MKKYQLNEDRFDGFEVVRVIRDPGGGVIVVGEDGESVVCETAIRIGSIMMRVEEGWVVLSPGTCHVAETVGQRLRGLWRELDLPEWILDIVRRCLRHG